MCLFGILDIFSVTRIVSHIHCFQHVIPADAILLKQYSPISSGFFSHVDKSSVSISPRLLLQLICWPGIPRL